MSPQYISIGHADRDMYCMFLYEFYLVFALTLLICIGQTMSCRTSSFFIYDYLSLF